MRGLLATFEYLHSDVDNDSIPNLIAHTFLDENSVYEADDTCDDRARLLVNISNSHW